MKKFIVFAIIVIVLLNSVLAADALIKSHKAEQRAQTQFEIEQHEKLSYEVTKLEALQNASDQYEELQYKLMCQIIEENSDYYESFSKKCIFEFKEYEDDEFYAINGFFDLYTIINNKLDNEFNRDLVRYDCRIYNVKGIIFVVLGYPVSIKDFYFSSDSIHLYSYDCSIIYIPDEFMNEESITTVKTELRLPIENIKGNLFVMKHPVMNY
jgi:aspartyl/asparaginyl-tRNA synthetase